MAADLHGAHKLATAEAIVYATARQQGADLLTCDRHAERLSDLALFAKAGQP